MLTRVALFLTVINLIYFVFSVSMYSPTAVWQDRPEWDALTACDDPYTSVRKFLCATENFKRNSVNIDITQIFGDWIMAALAFIEIFVIGGGISDILAGLGLNSIVKIANIVHTAIVIGAAISFISGRYV
jgi:hypothetical protein